MVRLLSSSIRSRAVFNQAALDRGWERFFELGRGSGVQWRILDELHHCEGCFQCAASFWDIATGNPKVRRCNCSVGVS